MPVLNIGRSKSLDPTDPTAKFSFTSFMPSSLRSSKTQCGENMSSGRGFGQSGNQSFDGTRAVLLRLTFRLFKKS